MEEQLIEFIRKNILSDPETEIVRNTRLISSGLIDSFSLVILQTFIENQFGKKIPSPRITAESFDSVGQMLEIIIKY